MTDLVWPLGQSQLFNVSWEKWEGLAWEIKSHNINPWMGELTGLDIIISILRLVINKFTLEHEHVHYCIYICTCPQSWRSPILITSTSRTTSHRHSVATVAVSSGVWLSRGWSALTVAGASTTTARERSPIPVTLPCARRTNEVSDLM